VPERPPLLLDPGAQWEGPVGEQFENKPRFEFNKTHLAVLRVVNEYRNNRITVDFVPKDGSQADELADTCDGLFRADEQDSGAQEAYDNCFEEGTSGGMGAIRLRARYEDEDDDEDDRQRIAIEPIYEADTCVFFSLDGKRYDKADAKRCYVLTAMSPRRLRGRVRRQPGELAEVHHPQPVRLVHARRGVGGRGLRDRGKDRAGALLPWHRLDDRRAERAASSPTPNWPRKASWRARSHRLPRGAPEAP
jgi:hypothetical protein